MSDKLKPCPFCGGEATIFQLSHSDSGGYEHPCEVGCVKCGIFMKRRFKADDLYHGYPTNEEHEQVNGETVKAWNTRARPKDEWIARRPSEKGLGVVYECPFCEYEVDCVPTNFCPNCGADMRGNNNE